MVRLAKYGIPACIALVLLVGLANRGETDRAEWVRAYCAYGRRLRTLR